MRIILPGPDVCVYCTAVADDGTPRTFVACIVRTRLGRVTQADDNIDPLRRSTLRTEVVVQIICRLCVCAGRRLYI